METYAPQHGGYRPGAGRRRTAAHDGEDVDGGTSIASRFDAAKTLDMEAKAGLKQLEYERERGALVERISVQAAAATAMQMFVQTVRSVPDVLERTYGVKPEVVEQVAIALDEALSVLANELQAMTRLGL